MEQTKLYIDRTSVRSVLIQRGSADLLAEIDQLPILMMDGDSVEVEPKARMAFVAHVRAVQARAEAGDEDATRSLACMALLTEGWRPGPHDDGGGEVIDLQKYRMAA